MTQKHWRTTVLCARLLVGCRPVLHMTACRHVRTAQPLGRGLVKHLALSADHGGCRAWRNAARSAAAIYLRSVIFTRARHLKPVGIRM